jgi:hypothetical protein
MDQNRSIGDQQEKIEVPTEAIKAFLDVRDSGATNMFHASGVLKCMNDMEHYAAVVWLAEVTESGRVKANMDRWSALMEAVQEHFRITHKLAGDIE